MIAKTKKIQLEKKAYIKMAMISTLKKYWWHFSFPVSIALLTIFWPNTVWFIVTGVIGAILYVAFWYIQFYGVTNMEQNKLFFEKFKYEIDSRQILMKLNDKQAMPLTWDQVKRVEKTDKHYNLFLSQAQFINLPFDSFLSDNDLRFFDSILKRKEYLK
jgi:hypothetical protein